MKLKHLKMNLLITVLALAFSMPLAMAGKSKLQMMDTNGDGNISAAEHAEAAAKRFAMMDLNGDGVATKEEIKEMKQKAKEEKKAKKAEKEKRQSESNVESDPQGQ